MSDGGQRLERAVGEDERVVRGERLELVRRGDERVARQLRELRRRPRRELGVGVEAGADRGAAEGQLAGGAGSAASRCATPWSSCATQPEISWPSVSGVAS